MDCVPFPGLDIDRGLEQCPTHAVHKDGRRSVLSKHGGAKGLDLIGVAGVDSLNVRLTAFGTHSVGCRLQPCCGAAGQDDL
jgi:hypothetical protein